MTWLDGEKLASIVDKRSLKDRNAIAMNMFRAWYTPFYYYGVIHGDPHLGNYTLRRDNSKSRLFDFGCIRIFSSPDACAGRHHALRSAQPKSNAELAVGAYKAWGFKNMSKDLVETLNIWANLSMHRYWKTKPAPMDETNTGLYGRETAAKVHR